MAGQPLPLRSLALLLLCLAHRGLCAPAEELFVCSFQADSLCREASALECSPVVLDECSPGPAQVFLSTTYVAGQAKPYVTFVFFDEQCSSPVPLVQVPPVAIGECVNIVQDTRSLMDVQLFEERPNFNCPLCNVSLSTTPPATAQVPEDLWVCAHEDGTCSAQGKKVCVQPPPNNCANLALPLDNSLRAVGVRLRAPSSAGTIGSLSLLNPAFEGLNACPYPLFYVLWNHTQSFRLGECLTFQPPAAVSPLPPKLWFSVHSTADCPDCANHTLVVTGSESTICTGKPVSQCLQQPECIWWENDLFSCTAPELVLLGLSAPPACGLNRPQRCVKPVLQHLCRLEGEDSCVPLRSDVVSDDVFLAIGAWYANSLAFPELTFPVTQVGTAELPSPNASMVRAHMCDVLSTFNRQIGLQFRGWEEMRLSNEGCNLLDLVDNTQWLFWAAPAAEHEIDEELVDPSAGFSGQRFLVGPSMVAPSLPRDDFVIGVSFGTNGVSVYGFNWQQEIAPALLVWEADEPLSWTLIAVSLFGGKLSLHLDGKFVTERPVPFGQFYHFCPYTIGWSLFGPFEGFVQLAGFMRPGEQGLSGGIAGRSELEPCRLQLDDFEVTAGVPFRSKPIVIRDSSTFSTVDLNVVIASFEIVANQIPGLEIDPVRGQLYGSIANEGTYLVLLSASTNDPTCRPSGDRVAITVYPPMTLALNTTAVDLSLTAGGLFHSGPICCVSGGKEPYTFSYRNLPAGLTYSKATGAIMGVAQEHGRITVNATVSDFHGGSVSVPLLLRINPPVSLIGQPFSATTGSPLFRATPPFDGGGPPFRFTLLDGDDIELPNSVLGLSFDPTTGELRGVPQPPVVPTNDIRNTTLRIRMVDGQGSTATEQIVLQLWPALQAELSTDTLHVHLKGSEVPSLFLVNVTASGGRPPYSYSLVGAPPGLGITSSGQLIGGIDAVSPPPFNIVIRDRNGAEVSTASVTITTFTKNTPISTSELVVSICAVCILFFALIGCVMPQKKPKPYDFADEHAELTELAYFDGELKKPEEIERSALTILDALGAGTYGTVYKAYFSKPGGPKYLVAVKQLRKESCQAEEEELLREAMFLAQIHHEHVLSLEGVVTASRPMLLVVQFMEHGSLLSYLHKSIGIAELSQAARFLIARDICNGMAFLEQHNIVHRDLAARNVLVDPRHRCVISDFGRTRHLDNSAYYHSHNPTLPVRWMPPEAFYQRYSSKVDVFSFGVTLVEVWSNGARPWANLTDQQVYEAIMDGKRLARPELMPTFLYCYIGSFWAENPDDRPSFAAILSELQSDRWRTVAAGRKGTNDASSDTESNLEGRSVKSEGRLSSLLHKAAVTIWRKTPSAGRWSSSSQPKMSATSSVSTMGEEASGTSIQSITESSC